MTWLPGVSEEWIAAVDGQKRRDRRVAVSGFLSKLPFEAVKIIRRGTRTVVRGVVNFLTNELDHEG